MTEEERKGLKVGDEIRAIKEYPRDTDWVVGDVFKIDKLHRNGDPHFIAGKGKGWYISKNMKNIHCFEVVHETSEGLRPLKKGEKALVLPGDDSDAEVGEVLTIEHAASDKSYYTCEPDKGGVRRCVYRKNLLAIRDEVVRGPDWGYRDQDETGCGVVVAFTSHTLNVDVKWASGRINNYRMNADHQDLKPTGESDDQVKEEELTTNKGPQVGGKIIVISDTGGNHTPGSVHKLTSTSALEDSMRTANGTLYNSEFFTIGDLVYKQNMVGKLVKIFDDGVTIGIQWMKSANDVVRHDIMKDGQLQWKSAPEGVGWGEKIDNPVIGITQEELHAGDLVEVCGSTGKIVKASTSCKNHEPITNEEEQGMSNTSETFRRLERAKEIEMTELPVAKHEEKAAAEKKTLLKEEMDRLLTFPTILSEKEHILSIPEGEWTPRDTIRAIELGLPVNINR